MGITMQHITTQEDNGVRHEYYLEKDMELPPERRKPYYVCYTYETKSEEQGMTREEIKNTPEIVDFMIDKSVIADSRMKLHKRIEELCKLAIKALEQEHCETIKEIPKDYKYDTETENFLVYRHIYTGHEIHIEKPVPRYRLAQQPCEDCVSRADVKEQMVKYGFTAPDMTVTEFVEECLPPVTPQPKIGRWIADVDRWGDIVTTVNGYRCSECNAFNTDKDNFCPNCGAKMQEVQE